MRASVPIPDAEGPGEGGGGAKGSFKMEITLNRVGWNRLFLCLKPFSNGSETLIAREKIAKRVQGEFNSDLVTLSLSPQNEQACACFKNIFLTFCLARSFYLVFLAFLSLPIPCLIVLSSNCLGNTLLPSATLLLLALLV